MSCRKAKRARISEEKQGDVKPKEELKMIPYKYFFRYVTMKEKVLIGVGTFSAFACGALLPSMSLIMGGITNTFDPDNSEDQILETMGTLAWRITLVGVACWIFGYMYYAFWQHLAENISYDLRSRYLHAILK